MNNTDKLVEATMLALQGKLPMKERKEVVPTMRRKVSKVVEGIDVNVDDNTTVSVEGSEAVVDTKDATVTVTKKDDDMVDTIKDNSVSDDNSVTISTDDTIMPEEIVSDEVTTELPENPEDKDTSKDITITSDDNDTNKEDNIDTEVDTDTDLSNLDDNNEDKDTECKDIECKDKELSKEKIKEARRRILASRKNKKLENKKVAKLEVKTRKIQEDAENDTLYVMQEYTADDLDTELWSGGADRWKDLNEDAKNFLIDTFMSSYIGNDDITVDNAPTLTDFNDFVWFDSDEILEENGYISDDEDDDLEENKKVNLRRNSKRVENKRVRRNLKKESSNNNDPIVNYIKETAQNLDEDEGGHEYTDLVNDASSLRNIVDTYYSDDELWNHIDNVIVDAIKEEYNDVNGSDLDEAKKRVENRRRSSKRVENRRVRRSLKKGSTNNNEITETKFDLKSFTEQLNRFSNNRRIKAEVTKIVRSLKNTNVLKVECKLGNTNKSFLLRKTNGSHVSETYKIIGNIRTKKTENKNTMGTKVTFRMNKNGKYMCNNITNIK